MTVINNPILTIVVPITKLSGATGNLFSWLRQAFKFPIRIILVHDKQDDFTGSEIRLELEKIQNKSIRLYEGKFGNPGVTRNYGMNFVETDYIAFWDADDCPNLENFLVLIREMIFQDADIGIGEYQINNILTETSEIYKFSADIEQNWLSVANNPGIWRMAFKKSKLQNIHFPSLSMGEDQVFFGSLLNLNLKVIFHDVVVYNYFVGNANQLTNQSRKMRDLISSITTMCFQLSSDKFEIQSVMICRQLFTAIRKPRVVFNLKFMRLIVLTFLLHPLKSVKIIRTGLRGVLQHAANHS